MLKNSLLTSASALCIASTAAFADGYTPAPVTPVVAPVESPWQGVFYGVHAGYAATEMDVARPSGPPGPPGIAVNNDPEGFIGGGHVGYNFLSGNMVYGVVGDFTWMDLDDTNADAPPGPPSTWRSEMDWMLSVRGRVGVLVSDNALVYGHAGLAYGKFRTVEVGGAGPWANTASSDAEYGYILGLGGEAMVSRKMSVFAEYSYAEFDDIPSVTPAGPPGTISFDNDPLHLFKLGLNFRF